jgi:hypothetical protein
LMAQRKEGGANRRRSTLPILFGDVGIAPHGNPKSIARISTAV